MVRLVGTVLEERLNMDVLRDLVQFVQFKKREQHPCRSVTLLKVTLLQG